MPEHPRRPAAFAQFPPAWLWLVDEAIPSYVKREYSPRESWKDKPFSREDAHFFFRSIEELSETFTEERPRRLPAYFQHPKFRSGYLLYFLPLQAAKFLSVFELHRGALDAALRHARESGSLKVLDLGSGPGTASIALLLKMLSLPLETGESLPKVELDWYDTSSKSMEDGKALAEQLASHFPKLRGRVAIRLHAEPWWKAAETREPSETSLILMGHVLNESLGPAPGAENAAWRHLWGRIFERARGGGLLAIEPAARHPAQNLSRLRDAILEAQLIEPQPSSIWGPCLHAGRCPLAQGRDWCHFSVPAQVPGTWFREFSRGLGSERQWLKFSYLWLASPDQPAPMPDPRDRRVISDPLRAPGQQRQGPSTVLICEPDAPGKHAVTGREPVGRGSVVRVSRERET